METGINDIYSTDDTALFVRRSNDEWWPMRLTGLSNIKWMHVEKTTVCENCHSLLFVNSATCKQCGAPAVKSVNSYSSVDKATINIIKTSIDDVCVFDYVNSSRPVKITLEIEFDLSLVGKCVKQ